MASKKKTGKKSAKLKSERIQGPAAGAASKTTTKKKPGKKGGSTTAKLKSERIQ